MGMSANQQYINMYWRNFHPAFPVLHKLTYQRKLPSPLLQAAIIAVGTHYSTEPHADSDARVMHEKCNQLLANVSIVQHHGRASSANIDQIGNLSMDDMQAIFLIEMFSQFRTRRSPRSLSGRFVAMYEQV